MSTLMKMSLSVFLLGCSVGLAEDRGQSVQPTETAGLEQYDPGRCHALVIGIDAYREWAPLRCARADAEAVSNVLRVTYGYKDIVVLVDADATRKNILGALKGYMTLGKDDSLLVYYAGHGWMNAQRTGYWVPVDAPRDSEFDYIPNSQLVDDFFKKYEVMHLLVIADSCFSGTLLRGGGEVVREAGWQLPAGFRKPSRWVFTSGDLAPVPDGSGGGHSPFAERIIQYMQYGEAGAFGVQDLYVFVRQNLKSGAICQPLDTAQHMPGGEFVFVRQGPGVAVADLPIPPPASVTVRPAVDASATESRQKTIELGDGVGLELVWIPSLDCWIGKYEVTARQYQQCVKDDKYDGRSDADNNYLLQFRDGQEYPRDDNCPIVWISWKNAAAFCAWLSRKTSKDVRLPTEHEWELASLGGGPGPFPWGSDSKVAQEFAWFGDNTGNLQPVGLKKPNGYGLYDAAGNAWEFCSGWYDKYQNSRPIRGGSWYNGRSDLEAGSRNAYKPTRTWAHLGFRVVVTP